MNIWEWVVVILLNGSIVGYGLYLGHGGQSSGQWFLADRKLPWWLLGLSMYATAIDAADLVADSGATYQMGFSFFVGSWVGAACGWARVYEWTATGCGWRAWNPAAPPPRPD